MLNSLTALKAIALGVVLSCLFPKIVSAQMAVPKVIPPSPEASALFKYLDYPVDHSTGIPQINIPVYTINSGSLEVPISISYHASGRKISDETGAVGLGWTLNCGGMISRIMYGKPDEETNFPSELKSAASLNNRDDYSYLASIFHNNTLGSFSVPNVGNYDSEYDIFSYSFGFNSGKFIIRSDKASAILLPAKPFKIPVNAKFPSEIIDNKGTIYSFDLQETVAYGGLQVPTGKYLTGITSANRKDNISFKYKIFSQLKQLYTEDYIFSDDFVNFSSDDQSLRQQIEYNNGTHSLQNSSEYRIQRITEVAFKEGKIIFNLDGSSDRIKNIQVLNVKGEILKTFEFEYSILDFSPSLLKYNYKLDRLLVKDKGKQIIEKYSFEYNASQSYSTQSRDYWGYLNATDRIWLIPFYQISIRGGTRTIGSGGDRNSYVNYAKQGVLKKITFPTGGSTEFFYEGNTIKPTHDIISCGGLRVYQIKSRDNVGNIATKTYQYPKYGSLAYFPAMMHMASEKRFILGIPTNVLNEGQVFDKTYRTRSYFSEYFSNLSYIFDQPVFYDNVTEYLGTESNNIGRIIYSYDPPQVGYSSPFNAPGFPSGPGPRGEFRPTQESLEIDYEIVPHHINEYILWNTATLTSSSYEKNEGKDGNGNIIYKITRFVQNNYRETETEKLRGLHLYKYCEFPADNNTGDIKAEYGAATYLEMPVFLFADYYISIGKKELERVIETEVSDNGVVTKSTNYLYHANGLVKEIHQSINNNDLLITQKKYPFDFTSDALLQTMTKRNMLDYVIEQHEYKNTTPLQSIKTTYKDWGNDIIASEVVSTRQGTNAYEPRLRYKGYDDQGNILSVAKENDLNISYLWGYNQTYPIAEIKNAKNLLIYSKEPIIASGQITYLPGTAAQGQKTATFTTTSAGTISLNINFGGNPGSSTATYSYTLSGAASRGGTLCVSAVSGCSYPSAVNLTNLPAGTYTLTTTYVTSNATTNVNISYSYPSTRVVTSGTIEFYYEGFEEDMAAYASKAHTGYRSNYGRPFTVNFTKPNSRAYLISWHEWNTTYSKWVYKEEAYSGPGTKSFSSSIYVDDIRVYPADAHMTTYTYDPLRGLTSATNASGITTYYEYDDFGRLMTIKDDQQNILKKYEYRYANQ